MNTKVTYLDNSGFMVKTDDAILVFDYYRDPAHNVKKTLEHNPEMPVVFFVSHGHPDHYNDAIFDLGQNHKRTYVLSNDIRVRGNHADMEVAGMSAGDKIENVAGVGITVQAYGSTDEGVSYAVTMKNGEKIFHAGDLNLWHWNEHNDTRTIQKAENEFKVILDRIAEQQPEFDIAFFPVDTRLGADMAQGAEMFVEKIKVANFFPCHYMGKYDVASEACAPLGKYTQVHALHKPGQTIDVKAPVMA